MKYNVDEAKNLASEIEVSFLLSLSLNLVYQNYWSKVCL